MNTETLSRDILKTRRQYFINKVKAPLRKALVKLTSGRVSWIGSILALIAIVQLIRKFPEPTKENTRNPNTRILIDIWDKFFEYENNPGNTPLFKAIKRLVVCEYEYDGYYRNRMDWFLEELIKKYQSGEWIKLKSWYPLPFGLWTEPSSVEAWKSIELDLLRDVEVGIIGGKMEMVTKAAMVTSGFFEVRSGSCPDCGTLFDDSIQKPKEFSRYCPKCKVHKLGNIKQAGKILAKEGTK